MIFTAGKIFVLFYFLFIEKKSPSESKSVENLDSRTNCYMRFSCRMSKQLLLLFPLGHREFPREHTREKKINGVAKSSKTAAFVVYFLTSNLNVVWPVLFRFLKNVS